MSLPSIVFIVANDKREVFVGYTKDLEVTMSLIAEGRYDASLAARGLTRLVYWEEQPTVREAIARVDAINALSPRAKQKLIRGKSPAGKPVLPSPTHKPPPDPDADGPTTVYIVASLERESQFNTTLDLHNTMIRIRAYWSSEPNFARRIDRLVYYEAFSSPIAASKRVQRFKRMGAKRLQDLVTSANPEWEDIGPKHLLVPAAGAPYGPTAAPKKEQRVFPSTEGHGPEPAGGGVTADLPGGPRKPVGTRTGRYGEPWPPVEE